MDVITYPYHDINYYLLYHLTCIVLHVCDMYKYNHVSIGRDG